MNPGRLPVMILLLAATAIGCATYSHQDQADCTTLADCNTGKTCGVLVPCENGKCQVDQTIEKSCDQTCSSSADCPEGMHCRYQGLAERGTCVLDGTCLDSGECLGHGLAEPCAGSWVCQEGACTFQCASFTACAADQDCVVVLEDCCCGWSAADFGAVNRDMLDAWQESHAQRCGGQPCPAVMCPPIDDLIAVCAEGNCSVRDGTEMEDCHLDSDCVEVPSGCPSCDCASGYGEKAINRAFEQQYLQQLEINCAVMGMCQPGPDTCTERPPVCRKGHCTILGDQCGCNGWDPVCSTTAAGTSMTLPNSCQADCLGMDWYYHGRCDCQMDCDCGGPYSCMACAGNGVTYYCGRMEVECNGQAALYPGSCDPACDVCGSIDVPQVPVCGADFQDYADRCYVECLGRDWWHTGSCLPGEGQVCGPPALSCQNNELFCLTPPGCLECSGSCIKLGSCLKPEDCNGQPLAAEPCLGGWTCPDHVCTWEC